MILVLVFVFTALALAALYTGLENNPPARPAPTVPRFEVSFAAPDGRIGRRYGDCLDAVIASVPEGAAHIVIWSSDLRCFLA